MGEADHDDDRASVLCPKTLRVGQNLNIVNNVNIANRNSCFWYDLKQIIWIVQLL
jgi:hypothetical protein